MNEPSVAESALPTGLASLGLVICCLVGVLSGLIEVLLIPFYVGSYVFPITVVIAIVLNVALPRLVATMVDWLWAVALPAICWVLTVIVLGFTNTGSGSVLVPGYGQGQYVSLGLFFGGILAAFVSVIRERARLLDAERERAGASRPSSPGGSVRSGSGSGSGRR
jgi:uncharacterized membrane protein YgcG